MKQWVVVDRYATNAIDTDDLEHAWSICETAARCGGFLTVMSRREFLALWNERGK